MDNLIGKRLDGRYSIEGLVGVGGMANVYRGTDLKTGNSPVIYLNGNYIMFPIRYGHCILKTFLIDKVG